MTKALEGVRLDDRPPAAEGSELAFAFARRGEIAYWRSLSTVVGPASRDAREKRRETRARARLRSGKILDLANRFVCECRLHDVSASGLRLTLARNRPLPPRFLVYDDETGGLTLVTLVWRRGLSVGVRCGGAGSARPLTASQRYALQGRYYAIPD